MPGATRDFSYRLHPAPENLDLTYRKARKILGWACDGDDRVVCHGVTGEGFGFVQLNMTIKGRDKWAAGQIAQDILNYVTWGLPKMVDMALGSLPLPPHEQRGYARGNRTKRFRERRPATSSGGEPDTAGASG